MVALHVVVGLGCVVIGVVAMLSTKGPGRHPTTGTVYYWSLALVCTSMTILTAMRWPEDIYLFVLGVLSFVAATVGRAARRHQWRGWLKLHITGMGMSYIILLTAFYVDNGPHLPLWRALPTLAYWIGPSLVGVPIVIHALIRHPLAEQSRRRERGTV